MTPIRRAGVLFALQGAAEATLVPFVPLLLLERGLSPAGVGEALAAMGLAAFVVAPAWGHLADARLGREAAVTVGATIAAVVAVALFFVDDVVALSAGFVLLWAVRSPIASVSDAIALDRLEPHGRAGYGHIRLWMSAGWAVAVVGWGAILEFGSLRLVPTLYAAGALAVALWVHFTMRDAVRPHPPARRGPRERSFVLRDRRLLLVLLSLLLVNAAFGATTSFLTLRIHALGGGALIVGIAASLQALTEIPVMRRTPQLSRRIGHRGLFVSGCAIYVVTFLAWALISNAWLVSAVKLVTGVGFALAYVGSVVLVDDLVPPERRATGQVLARAAGWGLAPILGSLGGGFVYGSLGAPAMFVAAAAVVGVAAAVAWAATRAAAETVVAAVP